ncbi:uncharacterized protein LOC114248348 [Bombyx mandarina]|uniref:Uncharacterized protein LOC114248348 n=1 Tax=Bombyx mandarina TaxID=7092 RepID=A0A6J2K4Z4_BOMMA|nr:uncharacterized protein LOC114248348 [Bombyx mandarina]
MGGSRSRRVLGSRSYKNYSAQMLDTAVDLVNRKIISSLEASKQFLIPRRTIDNKVKKKHPKKPGAQQRLTAAEELDIIKVLTAAADFGSPVSRLELRLIVRTYLNKNNKGHLFKHNLPGKWWVKNFLNRHKEMLTERAVQNIKRVRASTNTDDFENYFENLRKSLDKIPAKNILNYDETNLSDNPGSTKCIFKRKVKYPERIMNTSKGNISIMFAATADGTLLPTYTVYKAEHLWTTWCENGPGKARYNRSKSGWFDSTVFQDWFNSVIIPWADKLDGPKLIIGDNLSSHLNIDIVSKCEERNIRFTFLPPNSTHISQPLDVAFFGPLKRKWRDILTQYKIHNPAEPQINKAHFPMLLKSLLEAIEINSKANICAGFKATGIVPFNPQTILRKIPDYEEQNNYTIDTALLDYLKANRTANPLQKLRNKKLNITPGKSISSQEVQLFMTKKKSKLSRETNRSNINEAQQTFLDLETNLDAEPVIDEPNSKTRPKVTILSEVRFSPYNCAYADLTKMLPQNLKKVDKSYNIFKSESKENLPVIQPEEEFLEYIDYENQMPSTSADNKRLILKKPESCNAKKKIKRDNSDDNSENSDSYSLRDTSEDECFIPSESESCEDFEEQNVQNTVKKCETLRIDSYVLVKFCGPKTNKYYVGKVLDIIDDSGMYVKFMRNRKEEFYWPHIDDISYTVKSDIEIILGIPHEGRRGTLRFDCIDFSKYNVQ